MKWATRIGLLSAVLLAALVVASPAKAGDCGVAVRRAVVVRDHHQAVKVVNPLLLIRTHDLLGYGGYDYGHQAYYGAYLPPPKDTSTEDLAASIKALSAELRSLKEQLGKPVMPPAPGDVPKPVDPFNPAKVVPQEDRLTSVLRANCASCHSDQATKGGGLALFKGGALVPFTPETLRDTIDTVSTGRMPRGTKLADGQKLELIRLAVGGK
jgi:hypothetical protein